jgi:predicted metal-dependent hydrolase
MGTLKVRRIEFQFDDNIAFQWNPGNPYWGNFVNYATFIAPSFERYFIKATRRAIPLIKDPAIKADAQLFCAQEAQHSKHHLAHLQVLTARYPALEQVRRDVAASYDALFENETLEYHLAYAAVIELWFGPLAKYVVENRDRLFVDADNRIASFIMWHLVEEFEHRNSAIDIFTAVVGRYFYRLRCTPSVVKHIFDIDRIVRTGFKAHVPQEPGNVGPSESLQFLKSIPLPQTLQLLYELSCTLLPYHNPDNIKQPDWVTDWLAAEAVGSDMRRYYPDIAP